MSAWRLGTALNFTSSSGYELCLILRCELNCKIIIAETPRLRVEVVSEVKEGCEIG